ncbi:ribokinase [Cohnella sp. WQ 127256]|uniref:ribokinase n=1 Tax=Cohnella sp. WQ 127256 TaxID=2938790 RepID=UPI0021178366|nr:ribokinase [Cohnella sp. WQ 127256]
MKIVVVGSINMDYSLRVQQLPRKGETVSASSYIVTAGGKGANQAVAARRLGAEVALIGALGADEAGRELKARLNQEGIDLSGVAVTNGYTGIAQITVEDSGENSIVIAPGANSELESVWIERNESLLREADFVLVQLEIPMDSVGTAVRVAHRLGRKVILNPAPAKPIPEELYPCIDILTPNETELQKLTGYSDVQEGAKALLAKGVKRVIVTLGERGCFCMDAEHALSVPSVPIIAIDATGAGDAFNGALAVALSEKMALEEALGFANQVGAWVASRAGAQIAMPYRREIDGEAIS